MLISILQNSPVQQPAQLSDEAHRAVDEFLREGESPNTMASYRSALRYWSAWHAERYGSEIQLPVLIPCVLQFIVDHAERSTVAAARSQARRRPGAR